MAATGISMTEHKLNLQDEFLNALRKNKTPTTVFLTNGVKLQGVVASFDNFSLLLRREAHTQLIYKHAISTIMPNAPMNMTNDHAYDEPETNPA
jgi:host factor-I protein